MVEEVFARSCHLSVSLGAVLCCAQLLISVEGRRRDAPDPNHRRCPQEDIRNLPTSRHLVRHLPVSERMQAAQAM